jgi:hypothetical protein
VAILPPFLQHVPHKFVLHTKTNPNLFLHQYLELENHILLHPISDFRMGTLINIELRPLIDGKRLAGAKTPTGTTQTGGTNAQRT